MTRSASIDEIARSLNGLEPPWLPAYDMRAYAAKVDSECGYSSEMMVALEINTRMFEEVVAYVHLCGAFGSMHPSTARQYECVRNGRAEIDDVLAHNATGACPTYTGLLASFVDRGILVRCAPG
ncbi:hypothetical protein [Burkholderia lata]|uniref:Uncharacterized protein n=1 Tax=Burkholderia lata (strain ATCC 17760 / DSM 23089 / LMG 22485 / NCIMB 9086 / R18194 / 383) TaxID=482957 RepID=A0A6P2JBI4_BURL3|nr:hypothetical protein [Burkholderia lata]VWB41444.1 hypothetical protein BLA15816_01878 [Burkholderia lata]VWB55583.1 hypothetical protein BLA15945_02602 [Burkholderia lata]